jgi:hypothetical protein
MTPDLHFYPVSDLRKAPTGLTDPKVVHPPSENRIDLLNHFPHWLADMLPKDFPEFGKECRAFLHLWHKLRSPLLIPTQHAAIFKPQEREAFTLSQIYGPTLVFVDLYS